MPYHATYRENPSLAEVHRYIEITKAVLEKYKTKPSPKLKQMEDKTAFERVQLTGSDQLFTASHSSLLCDLISSLNRRIGDVNQGVYSCNQNHRSFYVA